MLTDVNFLVSVAQMMLVFTHYAMSQPPAIVSILDHDAEKQPSHSDLYKLIVPQDESSKKPAVCDAFVRTTFSEPDHSRLPSKYSGRLSVMKVNEHQMRRVFVSPILFHHCWIGLQVFVALREQQSMIPKDDILCPSNVITAMTGRGPVDALARPWFENGDILEYVQKTAVEGIDKMSLVSQ
jgi:hypothetical protein